VIGVSQSQGERAVPLPELVGSMSLATDLGLGQPMEHVLRSTLIAVRLCETADVDESERGVTYYVGLLALVCCHTDSHEQAEWFGDDIALRAGTYDVDLAGRELRSYMLRRLGAGGSPMERARTLVSFLARGHEDVEAFDATHCQLASVFAARLGLGPEVQSPLLEAFEYWNGKGGPKGLAGEEISLSVRLVQLADVVEVIHRRAGVEGAVEVARARSGTQFDPDLVQHFCDHSAELLDPPAEASTWDAIIDADPGLRPPLVGADLDRALEAIADFADLKSPYTVGHSRSVAELAEEAARRMGLSEPEAARLRRAGLVHDLGRLGVSNAIWDKPGPLTRAELERVRLHPYLAERMLALSSALAPLGELAAQHHERLDGSGYPRGLHGATIPPSARVLAAADVYQAMIELRPHRPARSPDEAAAELRSEVRAGRLDGEAVNAVLGAAGHRVRRRREFPAGLTAREVEVFGLLARGRTNKQIAGALHITPKTVANHVEHIYGKIDCSTRAAASLFAMQYGLLGSPTPKDGENAP
jgi:HD-GYP domain-containing protein (c-di-GMP phosphodiesterase class II)